MLFAYFYPIYFQCCSLVVATKRTNLCNETFLTSPCYGPLHFNTFGQSNAVKINCFCWIGRKDISSKSTCLFAVHAPCTGKTNSIFKLDQKKYHLFALIKISMMIHFISFPGCYQCRVVHRQCSITDL